MSDIITRLLLKTNDFDANLNKSKQSVNSFQDGISGAAKTAGAGIAKFAGGIGLAMGASEAFMKTIRGSQTTSDEFDSRIRACQTSVNNFFTSLSTGDFTAFFDGLDGIAQKAMDANASLDQLGNARISYDYFKESFSADMANGRMEALDKSSSKEKRMAGFSLWDNALTDKSTKGESVKADALDALKKVLAEGNLLNANDISLKDFEAVLAYDVAGNSDRDKLKKIMTHKYDTYRVKSEELNSRKKNGGVPDWAFPDSDGAKERRAINDKLSMQQEGLNKQFKDAILFNQMLVKWGDQELINATQLGKEYKQIDRELSTDKYILNKAKDRFSKEKENEPKPEEKPEENSLAYFNAEIAKKNKELIKATDAQARAAVQVTIDELEAKKLNIKIRVEKDVFETVHGKANGGELKKAGLPTQGVDTKKINPFKMKSPISKKDIKLNDDFNESLSEMGSIMSSLSGAFDGNTASVLQWGATMIGTIAQTISATTNEIDAKKARTAASKEEAAAAVLSGSAKQMEAHAGIPFAGIAIGLAGVASIIAVMSSMPKFATGGIVPGVSFTGDKVPALLNSGEMILNGGQQSNLFRMLNSRLSSGITAEQVRPVMGNVSRYIMPTESAREVQVSGNFRVKGCDLELAIKNRISKTGKKSW